MSRFKFMCGCGKRLAAYDWMVGRLLTCPKCGATLTVPTPFQAEQNLHEMIDEGYDPSKPTVISRIPEREDVEEEEEELPPSRAGLVVGIVVLGAIVAAVTLYFILR